MRSGVFSFCKAIDTLCTLGPWIVTHDEIGDPHDLRMDLRVNGESRQESHSGNMSVTIPEILSHYSALGYSAGDVVRSEEHTSELQSQSNIVCRLLLEKKKQ